MDISSAYKQHQQIQLLHEELQETEKEIAFTDRAYNLAFIATFVLYFIFIWMMYVSDLWGFTTWLVENLSEFTALIVYGILATTLPLTMAMIKEIGYKHFAKYPNPKYVVFLVVGVLALAGVIYESISSSSQQQHISTANAEKSKAFEAVSGTTINVVGTDSTALAAASQKLARCEENLKRGKEKHCEGDKAKVQALQASQQAAHKAAETAGVNAMEAKARAMMEIKEEAYKPVFKAIRDSWGVSISTGVMIVTLFISVIFEISHLLLILFRAQQRQRRDYLRQSIIGMDANYMQQTGKAFDGQDFAEFSQGGIARPEPDQRQPFGFSPASASASPALFKWQEPKRPVGFAPWPGSKPNTNLADKPNKVDSIISNQPAPGSTYRQDLQSGSTAIYDQPLDRPTPRTVHAAQEDSATRVAPRTVHGKEGVKEFTDDLYQKLKRMVRAGQVDPTYRPVKTVLKGWDVGTSDRHRQDIAGEALDRMAGEGVLKPNPANDGSGIQKAKYILA